MIFATKVASDIAFGSDGETRYSDEKYNLKLTACETATIIIPNSEEYEKLS